MIEQCDISLLPKYTIKLGVKRYQLCSCCSNETETVKKSSAANPTSCPLSSGPEAARQQVTEARKEIWITGFSAPETGWFFSLFQAQIAHVFGKLPVDEILTCADNRDRLNLALLLDALIYSCLPKGYHKRFSNTDVMFKSGGLKALAKLRHAEWQLSSPVDKMLIHAQEIAQQVLLRAGEDKVELYIGMLMDVSVDLSMMSLGMRGLAQLATHDDYCCDIAKKLAKSDRSLSHQNDTQDKKDTPADKKDSQPSKSAPSKTEYVPPGYERLLWALGHGNLSVRKDSASLMVLLVEDPDGVSWFTASSAQQLVTIMKEANHVAGIMKEETDFRGIMSDFEFVFEVWKGDFKVS